MGDAFTSNTSAGGELKNCEILLFGNSEKASGDLRIGHSILKDVVDSEAVRAAARNARLPYPVLFPSPGLATDNAAMIAAAATACDPPGAVDRVAIELTYIAV